MDSHWKRTIHKYESCISISNHHISQPHLISASNCQSALPSPQPPLPFSLSLDKEEKKNLYVTPASEHFSLFRNTLLDRHAKMLRRDVGVVDDTQLDDTHIK